MKTLICLIVFGASSLFGQGVPTVLKGGGVQISVDLTGFKQDLGVEKLEDKYFRLIQFSSLPADQERLGGRLIGSILVDEVPVDADTKEAFADPFQFGLLAAMKRMPAPFFGPTAVPTAVFRIQRIESPMGVMLDYPEVYEINGKSFHQHHIYFESVHGGKWIEVHFSVPSDKLLTDVTPFMRCAKSIIASMKFLPIASK